MIAPRFNTCRKYVHNRLKCKSIPVFFDVGSHGTKIPYHESDSIGFFHPQFSAASHRKADAGARGKNGEGGNLVNEKRNLRRLE
jgi:hypothetical protein